MYSTVNYQNGHHTASSRAESYKEISTTFQVMDGTKLIELLSITEGSKVLDLGRGTGNLTVMLAEKVGPKGCVIGVDQDGERIKVAKRRMQKITSVLSKLMEKLFQRINMI